MAKSRRAEDSGLFSKAKRSTTLDRLAAEIGHQRRANQVLGVGNKASLVVPSFVSRRGKDYQATERSQTSENVAPKLQQNKIEATKMATKQDNGVVVGMHHDHKPRQSDGRLVGFDDFKFVVPEKIEIGGVIARNSKSKDGTRIHSLAIVEKVVRNPDLAGGGAVQMRTLFYADSEATFIRKTSKSSCTFDSLCSNRGAYRIYPFNITQALGPVAEEKPEVVEDEKAEEKDAAGSHWLECNTNGVERLLYHIYEEAKETNRLLKELVEKWQ